MFANMNLSIKDNIQSLNRRRKIAPRSYLLHKWDFFALNYKSKKEIVKSIYRSTDYGRQVRKSPSRHGQKSNPNPKFLDTAKAYFVCHIGPKFQIS